MYRDLLSLSGAPDISTPAKFLEAAGAYFAWAEDNPLQEQQVFHNKGAIVRTHVDKLRAFSLRGLAAHMRVSLQRLNTLIAQPQYQEVAALVEQVIYNQKFEAAAAGLLHANIIARDLGLVDKVDTTSNGKHVAHPPEEMDLERLKKELEERGLPTDIFG